MGSTYPAQRSPPWPHVPGNILEGNWRAAIFIDDKATKEQEEALLKVYTGKLGGPVADLVKLIGEVVSVERAPISFDVRGGKGTITIGDAYFAELEPYLGATGGQTTLSDTIFRPSLARRYSLVKRRVTARRTRRWASISTSRVTTRCKARSCSTLKTPTTGSAIARTALRRCQSPGTREGARTEMRALRHESVFLPVLGGLIALAWLTLWMWSASPYGRYLEHGNWFDGGLGALICRAVPAGGSIVPMVMHAAAWVMMITAMMLPTTLPLLEHFRRLTAARPDHVLLMASSNSARSSTNASRSAARHSPLSCNIGAGVVSEVERGFWAFIMALFASVVAGH